MKLLLTILLFSSRLCFSQTGCQAIIDWQYVGVVKVYYEPNGLVIAQMQNDTAQEDFLSVTILGETEKYFNVSIAYAIKDEIHSGWIKKKALCGCLL